MKPLDYESFIAAIDDTAAARKARRIANVEHHLRRAEVRAVAITKRSAIERELVDSITDAVRRVERWALHQRRLA